MVDQQQEMIANYERLLKGERMKFDNGESSIFLINSRENSKLEAEIKQIELIAAFGRSVGALNWSSGNLATRISPQPGMTRD
jgi:hypothetical protein